jgi:hypothetical protein
MKTIDKKPIPPRIGKETTAPKWVDDERLFASFFPQIVRALITANMVYNREEKEILPLYNEDELLDMAQWYTEQMVKRVKDRREVGRFGSRGMESDVRSFEGL